MNKIIRKKGKILREKKRFKSIFKVREICEERESFKKKLLYFQKQILNSKC